MIPGSDLSQFQPVGTVPRPGERFWYVRCGDGASYTDPAFDAHVSVAKRHGLYVGPYLFWRAGEDPSSQAMQLSHAVMRDPRLITAAIDVEEGSIRSAGGTPDGLTTAQRSMRLDRLHDAYHAATGRPLVIYTNRDTMGRLIGTLRTRDRFLVWAAEWGPRLHPIPGLPAPLFWQTADHGGAGGGDADLCLGTEGSLAALLVRPAPGGQVPPGLPGGGTLRLFIEGHQKWAGWPVCIGPMRWIDQHGIHPQTRCWIAWQGQSWTGATDVGNVIHDLLTRFHLI